MKTMFLVLILIFFVPVSVNASCEGVTPTKLLMGWYSQGTGSLIKEIGDESESSFVLVEAANERDIFETQRFNVKFDAVGSNKYHQIPPVLTWYDHAGPVPDVVARLYGRAQQQGLDKNLSAMSYPVLLARVRQMIAEETKLQPMKVSLECPYTASNDEQGNLKIYQRSKEAGYYLKKIPESFETKVAITKTRCFGNGVAADFLAVGWQWECQGQGDAIIPVKELK